MATLTIITLCTFLVLLAVRLDRAERELDRWRAEAIWFAEKYAGAERDKHDLYCDALTIVGRRVELWERVQRAGRN